MCVITEIDKEKEELLYLMFTIENPIKVLSEKIQGSIIEGSISSSNDYTYKTYRKDIDATLHDLRPKDPETELKNYKVGDK